MKETAGTVEITVGGGSAFTHQFSLIQTEGAATIVAGDGSHDITCFNTTGSLNATLGSGDDHIFLDKTLGERFKGADTKTKYIWLFSQSNVFRFLLRIGFADIVSGEGTHNCTFLDTAGTIDVSFGSGTSHLFALTDTDGSVTMLTGDGNRVLSASNTSGSMDATFGDGNDVITTQMTAGSISITSLNGDHDCNFDGTEGFISVEVGNGASHSFILKETNGAISIEAGNGDCVINADNTVGSLTAELGDGNDDISLADTNAEVSITTGDGDRVINVLNTSGSFTGQFGDGDDHAYMDNTEGSISINSGDGFHNYTFDVTIGSIDISATDGDCLIKANGTAGSLTADLGNGNDYITLSNTNAEVSITSEGDSTALEHHFLLTNTTGSVAITTGHGYRNLTAYRTEGASFSANFQDGNDDVQFEDTTSDISIRSGDGVHTYTFDSTRRFSSVGSIDVEVGHGSSHIFTLSETVGHVTLDAGDGDCQVIMEDTSDGLVTITTGQNNGVGIFNIRDTTNSDISIMSAGGASNDVDIINTDGGITYDGDISVIIGPGLCTINTIYTAGNIYIETQGSGEDVVDVLETGGNIDVRTWDGDDIVYVDKLYGSLFIDVGPDDDVVYIDYLGGNGTVLGGQGKDLLLLDARGSSDEPVNTMDRSHLDWNGGEGDDSIEMYFVSSGTSNLNIVGDNMDVNQVIARCSDEACIMLSRRTFLANVHDPGASDSSLERINLDPTASITTLLLYLNGGDNAVHFDDTISVMDVFGGDGKDSFHVSLASCFVCVRVLITYSIYTWNLIWYISSIIIYIIDWANV